MFDGQRINSTENRSVLHVALRSDSSDRYFDSDGRNVVDQVHTVSKQIRSFAEQIRNGNYTNFLVIGIGGSYLGTEFVYEALKNEPVARCASEGFFTVGLYFYCSFP